MCQGIDHNCAITQLHDTIFYVSCPDTAEIGMKKDLNDPAAFASQRSVGNYCCYSYSTTTNNM